MARQQKIYVLRVSDYGTTGVPSGDEDMNEPWFGLVPDTERFGTRFV